MELILIGFDDFKNNPEMELDKSFDEQFRKGLIQAYVNLNEKRNQSLFTTPPNTDSPSLQNQA
jgi:hypothetical protein